MARETKTERLAREATERTMYFEELRTTYPARLLSWLERAQDVNFELRVRDGMYTLYDRDERRPETVMLAPQYTDVNEEVLDRLAREVEYKETEEREANRKLLAKQTALAKLSNEERTLLGLA